MYVFGGGQWSEKFLHAHCPGGMGRTPGCTLWAAPSGLHPLCFCLFRLGWGGGGVQVPGFPGPICYTIILSYCYTLILFYDRFG